MTFWIIFWTMFLVLGVLVFAGLAIAVTIGGFRDIRAMFRKIDQQHAGEEQAPGQSRGQEGAPIPSGRDPARD